MLNDFSRPLLTLEKYRNCYYNKSYMNNFLSKITKTIIFFSDIGLLFLSLWLTLLIRYRDNFNLSIWQIHWPIFCGLFAIWLVIFYAFDLYDLQAGKNKMELFNNYLKAVLLNIILGVLYFYLQTPQTEIRPKTILIILTLIFSFLFFVWRKLLIKIFNSEKLFQNLLFIGYEPLIKDLLPKQGSSAKFGFNYMGIVSDKIINDPDIIALKQYDFIQLNEIIKKEKINLLVINEPENEKITNLLFQVLPFRINFISLTSFYEQNTHRIPLKIISQGWFLNNFTEGNKSLFETTKRIVDIIFSVVFGIISFLLIPFIILMIAVDSKGKIIFQQKRVGKDGRIFLAIKFRTMYQNAENNGPTWAQENDPRVTRIGKFLRKIRLDEIPQLWNVLKGEMSFVGPRPERPEFIEQLIEKIPFYKERLLVKPGLTGWAQINFPYASSVEDSVKKLQYDLYYIKHRSLLLDLSIILKTINIIIKGGGR